MSPLSNNVEVKDEPTIVCMRKSQHGTQNVKTHNRRTQNTKKMNMYCMFVLLSIVRCGTVSLHISHP
jgi:hypothetical protein